MTRKCRAKGEHGCVCVSVGCVREDVCVCESGNVCVCVCVSVRVELRPKIC